METRTVIVMPRDTRTRRKAPPKMLEMKENQGSNNTNKCQLYIISILISYQYQGSSGCQRPRRPRTLRLLVFVMNFVLGSLDWKPGASRQEQGISKSRTARTSTSCGCLINIIFYNNIIFIILIPYLVVKSLKNSKLKNRPDQVDRVRFHVHLNLQKVRLEMIQIWMLLILMMKKLK